jgi:RNA polymerase sigma-70 factor (ECF subfamily)
MQINEAAALYIDNPSPRNAEALFSAAHSRGMKFLQKKFYVNKVHKDEALALALAKMFSKIHQFDAERGQFVTWFLTITNNEMLQEIKRMERARSFDEIDCEIGLADVETEHDPDMTDLAEEIIATLRSSDDKHHLAHLDWYDGLSYQQIADKRGISLNTIKTHIRRSRLQLEEAFKKEYEQQK